RGRPRGGGGGRRGALPLPGRLHPRLLPAAALRVRAAGGRRPRGVPAHGAAARRAARDPPPGGVDSRAVSTLAPDRVDDILDRVAGGARLTDEEALALLASRDLLAVGEAAGRVRDATTDPDVVTFVVDRNV